MSFNVLDNILSILSDALSIALVIQLFVIVPENSDGIFHFPLPGAYLMMPPPVLDRVFDPSTKL